MSISFTNLTTGASANAVYRWDFGNGNTSALRNPGAIYNEEKTYTVTLTVTDGTQTATKTATVTVYKKPTVDFSVAKPKVCLPDAATFSANATAGDGSISNYFWDFGDGTTQQGWGNTVSHYYLSEQKPTVTLTVTNSYGCYNSVTKAGTLDVLGRMNATFNTDKNLLCTLDEAVQLTNNSTGPGTLNYAWDFGDGNASTQKNPSHKFSRKGVFPVRLTVTNTDGCSATTTASVNAAYFNTDFSSRPLCREVTFTSSSYLYPGNSVWQFGDGSSANAYTTASHVYNAAGTYKVILINTYSGCKDTVSKNVQVEDLVNFNSTIEAPVQLCKEYNYAFKSRSSTAPGNSFWEFGDGGTANWGQDLNHAYYAPGTYTVKLTNTFGTCKETVTKTVTVNDLPNPQGFLVDYGGICGAPVTVKFKDTTATATRWEWRLDYSYTNPFSTQQNSSYPFNSDGTHYVYLNVTNAAGCSRGTSKAVHVYRPSVSIYYLSTSSPVGNYDCDSLTIRFGANSNQPIKNYLWSFGDGTTSTEETPQHQYKTVGIYPVTLNYTTESGCTGVAYYTARVYGKPEAKFSYVIPCGNALSLQFRDQSYFSDNWRWKFGDSPYEGYHATPTFTFPDTGKYRVTFINRIGSCADTTVQEVYANVLPSSLGITTVNNTCEGNRGTVTFDQRSLRISGGVWDFGDGTTMPYDTAAHNIKHTYARTGTYTVTLMGQGTNCMLTDQRTVHILLKQNPVLTANKTEICSNDNVGIGISNLTANPFTGNVQWGQYYLSGLLDENGTAFMSNPYTYDWQYTNYTTTLQGFRAGITKIRAVVSAGNTGCSDTTNYTNLKVNGPVAGFKVLANGICYKSPFVLEDTSKTVTNTPLRTWQWDFGDGQYETRTQSGRVEHRYAQPGNYTVRLTVTDASGCVASFSYTVNAKGPKAAFSASGLYVPNVPLNTTVTFYNNTVSWYSNSVNYLWQYGDGATSTNYTGSHTYTQPGVNTVRLIATDPSLPCADTAVQVITVKDFNTAFTFSTTHLTNSSCPPVLVRINNLSVGAIRVLWDFGDGTASGDQFYPSHTYTKPGVYKITLYTYGYNGLTGTYVDSVIVSEPAAQITADVLQGCTSQGVTLQATATGTQSFTWDFGDGTVKQSTDATAAHQYLTPGIYAPKLIVKDAKGCTNSTALPDKIIIDSLAVVIKGIPAVICDSTRINFQPEVRSIAADRTGVPLTYHWNFGTGNATDTTNVKNAVFKYNKPGMYTVRFKVVSPFGCVKEVTENIVVRKKAKGSVSGPAAICAGSAATFTGSASTGPVEWNWLFGNGNTAAVANPGPQTFNIPGTYNIRLMVNHNGCSDTTVSPLVVHPNPVVGLSASKTQLCRGESVQLTATGGATYAWQPADGLNDASAATTIVTPLQTTAYTVEVGNTFGCKKSESVRLTVIQPFRLSLPSEVPICKGDSIQLNANGAASYQWISITTGLSSTTVSNPLAAPDETITYTVVGWDAYNCFKDTAAVTIRVQPLPTVVAEPDFQMMAAETHQLNATASADAVQWLWSADLYLSCTNCPSPVTTPRMPVDYVVTVKNQYGCAASDTVKVKLRCSEDFIFIPNAFTPNDDGKNDRFYIKGKGIGIIKSLQIFNRWGEPVFKRTNFNIDDASAAWDGYYKESLVPIGAYVYIAEMQCDGGQPIIKKGTVIVTY